jgi:hypothetical protein
MCITCPSGLGADKASNTCKHCPIDATVSIPCQVTPSCGAYTAIPFNYAGAANDICPDEFWLEMTGFGTCSSSEVFVEVSMPDATGTTCNIATGTSAVYRPGSPPTLLGQGSGPFTYSSGSCTADGKYCFPDECTNPAAVGTINTAGFTTLWLMANAMVDGSPAAGEVTIRTPQCQSSN